MSWWLGLAAALMFGFLWLQSRAHPIPSRPTEEFLESRSYVRAGDPDTAHQLLFGFYPIEENVRIWTSRQFVLELAEIPVAKSAELKVVVELNQTVIEELKTLSLKAFVNSVDVGSRTWNTAGQFSTSFILSPHMLKEIRQRGLSKSVLASFVLDKAIPPGKMNSRELGLIFHRAELVAK